MARFVAGVLAVALLGCAHALNAARDPGVAYEGQPCGEPTYAGDKALSCASYLVCVHHPEQRDVPGVCRERPPGVL